MELGPLVLMFFVCSVAPVVLFTWLGSSIGRNKSVGSAGGALIGFFGGVLGIIILLVMTDVPVHKRHSRHRGRSRPVRGGTRASEQRVPPSPEPVRAPRPAILEPDEIVDAQPASAAAKAPAPALAPASDPEAPQTPRKAGAAFFCPECGKKYRLENPASTGRRMQCSGCRNSFVIPDVG